MLSLPMPAALPRSIAIGCADFGLMSNLDVLIHLTDITMRTFGEFARQADFETREERIFIMGLAR
jgi:hypothetical protein